MNSIPVISLKDALQPGDPRSGDVSRQLALASSSSGFFYVIDHGVDSGLVKDQFAVSARFFDLPQTQKDLVHRSLSKSQVGYEAIGSQTLDASARPDVKESYQVAGDDGAISPKARAGRPGHGTNPWPAALPAMEPQSRAYVDSLSQLGQRLVQLLALSLDLDESYFQGPFEQSRGSLRMLRYPPQPEGADDRTFGAGTHTDWGAITILAQDAHGGLQVQMPDGHWLMAPPIADTFVVNLGDMIPRWTNGRYRSNPHRVLNLNALKEPRYSIAFFFNPDHEARIEPIATCVPPGAQPLYLPCTAGDHIREMFDRTYRSP